MRTRARNRLRCAFADGPRCDGYSGSGHGADAALGGVASSRGRKEGAGTWRIEEVAWYAKEMSRRLNGGAWSEKIWVQVVLDYATAFRKKQSRSSDVAYSKMQEYYKACDMPFFKWAQALESYKRLSPSDKKKLPMPDMLDVTGKLKHFQPRSLWIDASRCCCPRVCHASTGCVRLSIATAGIITSSCSASELRTGVAHHWQIIARRPAGGAVRGRCALEYYKYTHSVPLSVQTFMRTGSITRLSAGPLPPLVP